MMTKQIIAFNRNKIYTSNENPSYPEGRRLELLVSLTNELKLFSIIIDPKAILYLSEQDIIDFHAEILPLLKDKYQYKKEFKPLYPGFPEQVISKSDLELWIEQHYIYADIAAKNDQESFDYDKFEELNPWYSDEEKEVIKKDSDFLMLTSIDEKEFLKIPYRITVANNSLYSQTKDELVWFLTHYSNLELPENIPFKETLCIVMSYCDNYKPQNINDILRYSMYVMGSDPSLPQVKKYVSNGWRRRSVNPVWRNLSSLSRSERKKILGMIDNLVKTKGLSSLITDARREYGHWVLLSERVHSGDYKSRYPNATKFFTTLQTRSLNKPYRSWNSYVQNMYDKGESILNIAKKVSERPGELVRRFDSIIRRAEKEGIESDIMDIFLNTGGMNNKTLFELLSFYDKRESNAPRMIKINGVVHTLPPRECISPELLSFTKEVIVRKILTNVKSKVTEQDLDGKVVYIDTNLKNIPIPKDMRSSTSIIPSGTKIDIPDDKNFIRFFVRWIQEGGKQEDLDLHAFLSDGETKNVMIGWNTGYKGGDKHICAVHSGDVLNREGNCAEYVDIDINNCLQEGYKYVVMDVMNYKGRTFSSLPCWLGYDIRTCLSGGVRDWEPNQEGVTFCQKISTESVKIAAWLFDLENRKAIMLDAALDSIPINFGNEQLSIIKYYTVPATITTYDVVREYYIARGATVIDDTEAVNCEEKPNIDEYVLADDLVHDYTRVLEMLG